MKRHGISGRIALILLATTMASSCSLFGPPTGKLSIPFPASILNAGGSANGTASMSRAIPGATTTLRNVRVYLESRGGLIPFAGGSQVYEASIPTNNTLVIDGIPPLRDCVLYLSLGEFPGSDFRAAKYVKSGNFNVIAGATASVDLSVQPSPFADLLTLGDPQGVKTLALASHTYFLAGGKLYTDGSSTVLPITGTHGILNANALGAGKVQNADGSFDFSKDCVWISADNGVWALSSDGSALTQVKVVDSKNVRRSISNILGSGAIGLNYTDSSGVKHSVNMIYYQGKGILGGAASSDAGSWQWFDMADNLATMGATLVDAIKNSPSMMIADYSIDTSAEYGYVIMPAINSFRVGGDVVDKVKGIDSSNTSALMDAVLTGNTIQLPMISGAAPLITSVGKAGNSIFVGSDRGAFSFGVSPSDGTIVGSAQAIDLGRAVYVAKIKAKVFAGSTDVWTAVLGKGGSLYLLKNGILKATYPFFSGMPDFGGDATATGDLFWTDSGLVISGTNGVVSMSAATLPQ